MVDREIVGCRWSLYGCPIRE